MYAAENLSRFLDAVADDPTAAAWTTRCERLDRALEAVEGVTLFAENDLEGLVVVISADFTWSHIDFGLMFGALWDTHRHRCAPEIMAVKNRLQAEGRLVCHQGYIKGYEPMDEQVEVTYRTRGTTQENKINYVCVMS